MRIANESEQILISKVRKGDAAAMKVLYDRNVRYLSAVCSRYINDDNDLKDILVKAGASEEDLEKFQNAIDASLLYKAATPAFLNIPINTFSGYSMYLPANGSTFLNNFYKTLSWNTATSLVQ